MLRLVHGLVDEREVGRRCVRLPENVVRRGGVRGCRGEGDDEVSHREIGLEATAGTDSHDLLDPELDELLDHDCGGRAPHPTRLHRDRLAVECPGVTEHSAFGVSLHDVGHEGLGDVLGPQRIAGEEARFGIVAGVGSNVNWHGRKPTAPLAAAPK